MSAYLGEQPVNDNGQILGSLEKENVMLLNDDINCEGVHMGEKRTNMYQKMKISQEQQVIDISDHNMMEVQGKTNISQV